MWKQIFQIVFFIEPATGIILLDLVLPSLLVAVLYSISYKFVGSMYSSGLISGSIAGSFFHWFIRLGLAYIIILLFNIVVTNIIAFAIPTFILGILFLGSKFKA